jgi:hypothetical protein
MPVPKRAKIGRPCFPYAKFNGVNMDVHEYESAYYQVKDDVLASLPAEEE